MNESIIHLSINETGIEFKSIADEIEFDKFVHKQAGLKVIETYRKYSPDGDRIVEAELQFEDFKKLYSDDGFPGGAKVLFVKPECWPVKEIDTAVSLF